MKTKTKTITSKDIIKALKATGKLPKDCTAKATFNVPRGGDYSGLTLDIDDETPIVVVIS